jgi:hypothetical protein
MEEDIRQNNDTDGNQFINIEPAAKIIRLDEITDADVDDLEEQLFQKYSEVEDIRDDTDIRSLLCPYHRQKKIEKERRIEEKIN